MRHNAVLIVLRPCLSVPLLRVVLRSLLSLVLYMYSYSGSFDRF